MTDLIYLEYGCDSDTSMVTWRICNPQGETITDEEQYTKALKITLICIQSFVKHWNGYAKQSVPIPSEYGYEKLLEDPDKPDLPSPSDGFPGNFYLEYGWNKENKSVIWKFRDMKGKPLTNEDNLDKARDQIHKVIQVIIDHWNTEREIPATFVDMVAFSGDMEHPTVEQLDRAVKAQEIGDTTEEEENIPVELEYDTSDLTNSSQNLKKKMILRDVHTGDHIAYIANNYDDYSLWLYAQEIPDSYASGVTEPNMGWRLHTGNSKIEVLVGVVERECRNYRIRKRRESIQNRLSGKPQDHAFKINENNSDHIHLSIEHDQVTGDQNGNVSRIILKQDRSCPPLGHVDQTECGLFIGTLYPLASSDTLTKFQGEEWKTHEGNVQDILKLMGEKHVEMRRLRYKIQVLEWKEKYQQDVSS